MTPTKKSDELRAREIEAMTRTHEVHIPLKGEPDFIPKRTWIVSVAGYPDHEYEAISADKARWQAFRAYREATGRKSIIDFAMISTVRRKV